MSNLNLTQLGLSNAGIHKLFSYHLTDSKIKYLDLSNNPKLSLEKPLDAYAFQIENLKLSTSAQINNPNVNDAMVPKMHLACVRDDLQCRCLDVSEKRSEKSLGGLLSDCDAIGNECKTDCNAFDISEGVKAPKQVIIQLFNYCT